jgi:hypothetical protein
LVQATVNTSAVRDTGRGSISAARFEEKDISPGVLCTEVDMAENTGANPCLLNIENQVGVDIDNGGTLYSVSTGT